MEEYVAICKVKWFYQENGEYRLSTDYIVCTHITSATEAMQKIEKHYSNDLISAEVSLIEGPFFHMETTQYNHVISQLYNNFEKEG